MTRRTILTLAASGEHLRRAYSQGRAALRPRAVAFDAFAVFDPRPTAALAEKFFPGKGAEFTALWRTRQFEYTWLRTLTASYTDFWSVTEDALVYAAKAMRVDLPAPWRQRLMDTYSELRPWPEALAALKLLHDEGVRLALLSNFTQQMLTIAASGSGLNGLFEAHLSTDRVRAYKPHPRAYRMAMEALKLQRGQIVFAAFAGWDAAGAKAFGYPTFWVNRMGSLPEELGSPPDATGTNLNDLAEFVLSGGRLRS